MLIKNLQKKLKIFFFLTKIKTCSELGESEKIDFSDFAWPKKKIFAKFFLDS
jgi:hypothetical protein